MAIVHHVRGDDRSEIKNYPEIENEDGVLTYNVTGKDHLHVMSYLVKGVDPVVDPGGRRGHGAPSPVKSSHKKDGHQRRLHRIHVSRPTPHPHRAAGSATGI